MIRNPDELTVAIKNAVNRRAIVLSHIILAIVISGHTLLWPEIADYEKYLSVTFSIILLILIFFRFFDLARINDHPLVYTIIYMVMTFFGVMLLTEARTPHVLIAVIPVLISNLYYGARGVYITVVIFVTASIGKFAILYQEPAFSREDALDLIVGVLLFIAVASMFVSIQKVYDWDRTRLKSILREANIGQKRLRTLINSMTESVLVLDKNGVVKLYNAAALALFDTNASLEDKKPSEFADFEDENGKKIKLNDIIVESTSPITRTDIRLCYSREDFASLSITVTPLRASFGQGETYDGYIVTIRDITREKSLEEERNEFISVISHELRTPVTVTEASISNAMMINDKQGGNNEVKKTLMVAHDQSIYLANMLNDLSTFARAEKGLLELYLEDISPRELVSNLENDYRSEAEAKGLSIKAKVDESVPQSIVSNRLYIREILQNFITNAIKYSDEGAITLSAHSLENGGIKFSVSDQGIGIAKADQKKVFDKFFRSEDFRTRSRSGTGLGLYIVRKLAKMISANFELESEIGKGSTFSLLVPSLKSQRDRIQQRENQQKTIVETTKASSERTIVETDAIETPEPLENPSNQDAQPEQSPKPAENNSKAYPFTDNELPTALSEVIQFPTKGSASDEYNGASNEQPVQQEDSLQTVAEQNEARDADTISQDEFYSDHSEHRKDSKDLHV